MNNSPDKSGGIPSRQAVYQKAAHHAYRAIEVLAREMVEGDNSNARTSAARALLDKVLPNLKAQEVSGKDGEDLSVYLKLSDEQLNSLIASKARKAGIA